MSTISFLRSSGFCCQIRILKDLALKHPEITVYFFLVFNLTGF